MPGSVLLRRGGGRDVLAARAQPCPEGDFRAGQLSMAESNKDRLDRVATAVQQSPLSAGRPEKFPQ